MYGININKLVVYTSDRGRGNPWREYEGDFGNRWVTASIDIELDNDKVSATIMQNGSIFKVYYLITIQMGTTWPQKATPTFPPKQSWTSLISYYLLQVGFIGVRGEDLRGDIAIDDLVIREGVCDGENVKTNFNQLHYLCTVYTPMLLAWHATSTGREVFV